jgi:hypothetical protein
VKISAYAFALTIVASFASGFWTDRISRPQIILNGPTTTVRYLEDDEGAIFGADTTPAPSPDVIQCHGDLGACLGRAMVQANAVRSMPYDTRDEAAAAALVWAYKHLPYYEVGGVIVKRNGKFYVGKPRTQFHGDSVEFSEDPDDYLGEIVASYHTHPCNSVTHAVSQFSNQDMGGVRTGQKDGYMADLCTGAVHLWTTKDVDPHDDDADTSGKIIGHFPVDGTVLDAHVNDP